MEKELHGLGHGLLSWDDVAGRKGEITSSDDGITLLITERHGSAVVGIPRAAAEELHAWLTAVLAGVAPKA